MINVCQVVSDTNIGGAGRYILNYVKNFDRENFSVTVLIPENSMLKPELLKFSDISVKGNDLLENEIPMALVPVPA